MDLVILILNYPESKLIGQNFVAIHARVSTIHTTLTQLIPEKKHFVRSMVIFEYFKFIAWQDSYSLSPLCCCGIHLKGRW
jgi:hypothetical protein